MENVALKKKIIEQRDWRRPEEVTNGNIINYDSDNGFSDCSFPATLTIDLEASYNLHTVRMFLWDLDDRRYKYRFLTSIDRKNWSVHYDTQQEGFNGWQCFEFSNKKDVRFIRVDALHNTANAGFHIIQIEAYEEKPPELNKPCSKHKLLELIIENGDGLAISSHFRSLLNELQNIISNARLLNPAPIMDTLIRLRATVYNMEAIENNADSIRKEITNPINKQLESAKKAGFFSIWGFWVGLGGLILGIISSLLTIMSYLNKN